MTKEANHVHIIREAIPVPEGSPKGTEPTYMHPRRYTFTRMPAMKSGRLAMKLASILPGVLSGEGSDNLIKAVLSDINAVGSDAVYDLALSALTFGTMVDGKTKEGVVISGQLENEATFNQWFGEFPQDLLAVFYEAISYQCSDFFLGALGAISTLLTAKA